MRIFATLVLLPKFQNELVANNCIFMWILRLFIVNGWICEKKQAEGTGRHASMQNFFRMFRLHFFFSIPGIWEFSMGNSFNFASVVGVIHKLAHHVLKIRLI